MTKQHEQQGLKIKLWELNTFVIEAILAAGLLMALVVAGAPRLLGERFGVPEPVWIGLAAFVAFWATYPALNVYARVQRGRELPAIRALVLSAVGAVVGGLLYDVLS